MVLNKGVKMETNYLIHHGIKGQKWGVRRNLDKDSVMTTGRDKRDKDRNVIKKVLLSIESVQKENKFRTLIELILRLRKRIMTIIKNI